MKFQKGLLEELTEPQKRPTPVPVEKPPVRQSGPVVVEKDRLFQTVEETKKSSGSYLKLLAVVCVVVAVGGAVLWYMNRPGVGDKVRVSAAMELAVRDHFLLKEKRTATDIAFYQCDGSHWARVGVETRTDMPNPLMRVGTFAAKITPAGETWSITASPITSPELDVPCK